MILSVILELALIVTIALIVIEASIICRPQFGPLGISPEAGGRHHPPRIWSEPNKPPTGTPDKKAQTPTPEGAKPAGPPAAADRNRTAAIITPP